MTDAQLIDQLGGPAKVAELLGFKRAEGGVQRVHNWKSRGIPARVKIQWPALFLRPPEMIGADGAAPPTPGPAGQAAEVAHAG